jgi:cytidylate kinase
MGYRVLTVNREFGSGGGRIAKSIAGWLGWRLLDGEIVEAIAEAAHVDPQVVERFDEHIAIWPNRLNLWSPHGAQGHLPQKLSEDAFFNAERMTEFTRKIVEDAYARGNCVIVGRGAQCILQHKPEAFHAFIHAPFEERVKRLQGRLEGGANVEQRIRTVDEERAQFLLQRFGKRWNNPHLYNLMISSGENEDRTARVVVYAMTGQL